MRNDSSSNRHGHPPDLLRRISAHADSLYASAASTWQLSRPQFLAALERSAAKRFAGCTIDQSQVEHYLETLHIDDLLLATACMEGSELAWGHFVQTYRGYLRATAAAITKGGRSGTDAQELADSLFAELFGTVDGKRGEASLLRYFHGRSSLKTWLRTILAQRHIDHIRRSRRWESLEREGGDGEKILPTQIVSTAPPDPHRQRYLQRFVLAFNHVLANLASDDRRRLELYYIHDETLAEIGRQLDEHESSASRHLERVRRELRAKVEECLRTGLYASGDSQNLPPLSDEEIALCFQYAVEDAPIDFRQVFPDKPVAKPESGRKELP